MALDTARLKELLPLITSPLKIDSGVVKDESGAWVLSLFCNPGMPPDEFAKRLELIVLAINSLPKLVSESETSSGISAAVSSIVASIVDDLVEKKLNAHIEQMHKIWGSQ
jgi:hypothetical protein